MDRLYSPWGRKESDTTEQLSLSHSQLSFSRNKLCCVYLYMCVCVCVLLLFSLFNTFIDIYIFNTFIDTYIYVHTYICMYVHVCGCSDVSDSLQPHGL